MRDPKGSEQNGKRSNRSIGHSWEWDKCDPVANAVVALVDVQDALQDAFDTFAAGEEREDGTFASDAEGFAQIDAALNARANAIRALVMAQITYWRENGGRRPTVSEIGGSV